ncbi:LysE family translocator [Marinomonas sp. 2405UD68-3]|uniref:LysE family translocator n=1 Tax=Marinomonas sp. 2405UD68-3 TaxID=3391835 RepID=UPI0039C9A58B
MTASILTAMVTFALTMNLLPGPINMMLISSGLSNGLARTIPFIIGAALGFTSLLASVAFGLMTVADLYPKILILVTIIGSLYIMYMGYKVSLSKSSISNRESDNTLLKLHDGLILQWFNPKGYIVAVAGISMFSQSGNSSIAMFVLIFFIITFFSMILWTIIGEKFNIVLNNEKKVIVFNKIMGGLLVLTGLYFISNQMLTIV